jgi:hypothetical protein
VSETTSLLFLAVFTGLTVEPETAQLRLDLLFPAIFSLGDFRGTAHSAHAALASQVLCWHLRVTAVKMVDRRVESTHLELVQVFVRPELAC